MPNVPDALELSLEKVDLDAGERLKAFVRAPFAGTAAIAVMSDRLHHSESVDLSADGAEIDIAVKPEWGAGAYLMVTAFRPEAGKPSLLPVRAMGLAWFAIDRADRTLQVAIETPDVARPRQTVSVPLEVTGGSAQDGKLRLTLAAVDEGILQLTNFHTPDLADHYLGQRRLGIEIRDLYGRLIRPAEGRRGAVRSGGDVASLENIQGSTTRTVKTIAIYQREIEVEGGHATVTLDLPDFNGRLRLMAVVYGADAVGAGEADLVVRDPVAAELLLPRFLAPGDEAEATLSLHNLTGEATTFRATLHASGGVALGDDAAFDIQLDDQERGEVSLVLTGAEVGDGNFTLRVEAPGLAAIEREWDIAIRPAQPYITARAVTYLEAEASLTYGPDALAAFLPGTTTASLTITARPEFNVPELLETLRHYPYGCTEQAISRALPQLYFAEMLRRWDRDGDDLAIRRRIDQAILRVLIRPISLAFRAFRRKCSIGMAHRSGSI